MIEAESSRIGRLNLPAQLFAAMKSAPRLHIAAPLEARAAYLTGAYADLTADSEALTTRLDRLLRLQGREKVERWKSLAARGAFENLATELIRDHYDPRYQKVRASRASERDTLVETDGLSADHLERLADKIAAEVTRLSG